MSPRPWAAHEGVCSQIVGLCADGRHRQKGHRRKTREEDSLDGRPWRPHFLVDQVIWPSVARIRPNSRDFHRCGADFCQIRLELDQVWLVLANRIWLFRPNLTNMVETRENLADFGPSQQSSYPRSNPGPIRPISARFGPDAAVSGWCRAHLAGFGRRWLKQSIGVGRRQPDIGRSRIQAKLGRCRRADTSRMSVFLLMPCPRCSSRSLYEARRPFSLEAKHW